MEILSLDCSKCGAPLDIPRSVQHVTCNHCGARLAIRRTDSVSFTEVIQDVVDRTEELEEEVAHLKRKELVRTIDAEWEEERKKYFSKDEHGNYTIPREGCGCTGGVILLIVGGLVLLNSAGHPIPGLVGLSMIGGGLITAQKSRTRSREFQSALERYEKKRQAAEEGLAG